MVKKSIKTELNRYLKEMDKSELEKEVKKLYSKFKQVKQFYEVELGDSDAILEECKKKITQEYFPNRGYGRARNAVSRKVVTDFKKIAVFSVDVIELLLHRVEMMLKFTNAYGDITEAFYNSLESSFDEACKLIKKEKLTKDYIERCESLRDEAYHFGWGTYDMMDQSIDEYLMG
ncbi:MAG: DUF6155 family protein [Bacteroidota bacterium]